MYSLQMLRSENSYEVVLAQTHNGGLFWFTVFGIFFFNSRAMGPTFVLFYILRIFNDKVLCRLLLNIFVLVIWRILGL